MDDAPMLEPDESDEATLEGGLTERPDWEPGDLPETPEPEEEEIDDRIEPTPRALGAALPLVWMASELKTAGLEVVGVKGWQTRGRPQAFDPRGWMFHHTASSVNGGPAPALGICTFGRADLPGPLCNGLIGRDRVIRLVAAGRCNHAGFGGPWRAIPVNSGNRYLGAWEVENNGVGERWALELLEVVARATAAVLARMRLDASWELGHNEWTPRKIDPTTDMARARALTASILEGGQDDMGLADDYFEAVHEGGVSAGSFASNQVFVRGYRLFLLGYDRPGTNADRNLIAGWDEAKKIADLKLGGGGGVDVEALADALAERLAARLAT